MENINWPALNFIWGLIVTAVSVAAAGITIWNRRDQANKASLARVEQHIQKEMNGIEGRQQDQSRRITVVEEALKFSPRRDDLDKLRDSITRLSENVARSDGSQRSLERTVERMNQFLMERAK